MTDLEYSVTTKFSRGMGRSFCKEAVIPLDAALEGRADAFNPAELLLAAISACMTKGALRAAKLNNIEIRAIEARLKGFRRDAPPGMRRVEYELLIDTDAPDRRLELIHRNVLKFGTVTNTVAAGTELTGHVGRLEPKGHGEKPVGAMQC